MAPQSASEAATTIEEAMRVLRSEDDAAWSAAGHQLQVTVRSLTRHPDWQEDVMAALPTDIAVLTQRHLNARRSLGLLHQGFEPQPELPRWEIIEPEPLDQLIDHYQEAEAATGINWQILAAINLIETGMGRIDGLSTAGAQGPMQFLPTTWEEVAEGGDIDDPHDAIQGAARYLVRRGGLDDIRKGLWGYNNSDYYVDAVLTYAQMFTDDLSALRAVYHWEIYVGSTEGPLWLPVGFIAAEGQTATQYLAENPWALTLPATG